MAFKMKGSPMARNYGAPFKDAGHGDTDPDHTHGKNEDGEYTTKSRFGDDGFMTIDKDGNAVSRQQNYFDSDSDTIPLVEDASDEDKAARLALMAENEDKIAEAEALAAEKRAAEAAKKK
jgi:hypothetical protein|tara:strand:+ start:211 stop:570 length:360 start_codon:yes stop_codon:yes gene_type:complete